MGINKTSRRRVAPLLSLSLLVGMFAERQAFRVPPGDPTSYHSHVRTVAERLPYRIGEWVGRDVPPPPSAVALLKSNVLRGRRYQNASTGEAATLIIVQCEDARDMHGHYPPGCYPAHGWTLREQREQSVVVDSRAIPVSVYEFTIESPDRFSEIIVYNFFARPGGALENGQGGVAGAARDRRLKGYGAAQFQIVFDPSMKPRRRDEVFTELVTAALPIVDAVRHGVDR